MSTAWERWFADLKPGDRCRVRFPWVDGKTPGGHISIARVLKDQPINRSLRRLSYRLPNGAHQVRCLPLCTGYETLMPLDREVVYYPSLGFRLRPAPRVKRTGRIGRGSPRRRTRR